MDTLAPETTKEPLQTPQAKRRHVVLFSLAVVALIPIDPLILCLLWNWFAVKLGFPSLTYGYAFGLSLLLRFVISPGPPVSFPRDTGQKGKDLVADPKGVWMILAKGYLGRLYTIAAGAVIHLLLLHG
jgi:hypothetical protein